jgi:hypothetical protein
MTVVKENETGKQVTRVGDSQTRAQPCPVVWCRVRIMPAPDLRVISFIF